MGLALLTHGLAFFNLPVEAGKCEFFSPHGHSLIIRRVTRYWMRLPQ